MSLKIVAIIWLSLFMNGLSYAIPNPVLRDMITPTEKLEVEDYPFFQDDLKFESMITAIDLQISRLKQKPLNGEIKFGEDTYPESSMLTSLESFRGLALKTQQCLSTSANSNYRSKRCFKKLNKAIKKNYNVYRPKLEVGDRGEGKEEYAFFTAYNTPTIPALKSKSEKFPYGIYKKPSTEALRKLTRHQIDFEYKLEGTGNTLFYAPNLFDLYLLHIQGGGKIKIEGTGENFYLSFDGTNSRTFRWISKYMVDQGMLSQDNRSTEAQRQYIKAHPEDWERIFSSCPNYIYFKITSTPPLGSDNVPLTDNRSIATDRKIYHKKGLLAFVMTTRPEGTPILDQKSIEVIPEVRNKSFSRFFIDQDTGGAIKGKARADLYFGESPYAQTASEQVANWGKIFFFIKKLDESN